MLIATHIYNLSDTVFLDSARDFLDIWDIGSAMIKAACFGVLIAIIGCSWGLTTLEVLKVWDNQQQLLLSLPY